VADGTVVHAIVKHMIAGGALASSLSVTVLWIAHEGGASSSQAALALLVVWIGSMLGSPLILRVGSRVAK